jgi:hypothetical protein
MSCDPLLPDNSLYCCDTSITLTDLQQNSVDYYDCIWGNMNALMHEWYSAETFGMPDKAENAINSINDYHYLYIYLVIIYYQRKWDAEANPPCYTDKGLDYYLTEYNIECIKKYFLCKNVDIKSLLQAFDMYSELGPDGINFMAIEDTYPDTCSTNNELFIVEKPI